MGSTTAGWLALLAFGAASPGVGVAPDGEAVAWVLTLPVRRRTSEPPGVAR